MTILHIPTKITTEELAEAVARLPYDELEGFLAQVNLIRKRRASEVDLLATIRSCLPAEQRQRLSELREKLEAETLTEAERGDLLRLTERAEAADVKRAEALLALAQKRGSFAPQSLWVS
jgi:hypothetical protein